MPSAGLGAVGRFAVLEAGNEALNRSVSALVVLEGLAHDAACEGGGHGAHLGPELLNDLASFGFDLEVRV
ncbi:MAG: hypothetical protein ACR2FP_06570, partial [Nocardioidaceae bacterium]